MSKLPQVTPREMLRVLARGGFVVKRVVGSHHYLVHRDDPTRRTTVAMHSGDLPRRDVRDILKQTRISREDFLKLL
jgi:predicted RNA binding protein YcfA (HicA-like mRNA interferase family)